MLYDTKWEKKIGNALLHSAADLIEKHGFVKGQLGTAAIGYCMLGAIVDAETDTTNSSDIGAALNGIEKILLRETGCKLVPTWNDKPERTKEEVIAMLRKAAMEIA